MSLVVIGLSLLIVVLLAAGYIYERDLQEAERVKETLREILRVQFVTQENLVTRLNDALITWDWPERISDRRIEQCLAATPYESKVYAAWRAYARSTRQRGQ